MIHSASLRATGSVMVASAALASASLPLRVASITRFTAAMSAAEVVSFGATANGPAVGRASGLKNARVSKMAPRVATLACAKEDSAGAFCDACFWGACFCAEVAGVSFALLIAGRGRGNGTFCAVAEKASAHNPHAVANAKKTLKRLRLVALIQPYAADPLSPIRERTGLFLGQIH